MAQNSLVFSGDGKELIIQIDGYEFPDKRFSDDPDTYRSHDQNWLNITVRYSDGVEKRVYNNPCIQDYELEQLRDGIGDIAAGRKTELISKFSEPFLSFSITAVDYKFIVKVRYTYDDMPPEEQKRVSVTQSITSSELLELIDVLTEICNRYPFR